jgi:hypothetical protein
MPDLRIRGGPGIEQSTEIGVEESGSRRHFRLLAVRRNQSIHTGLAAYPATVA